jgi:hypothetical protein
MLENGHISSKANKYNTYITHQGDDELHRDRTVCRYVANSHCWLLDGCIYDLWDRLQVSAGFCFSRIHTLSHSLSHTHTLLLTSFTFNHNICNIDTPIRSRLLALMLGVYLTLNILYVNRVLELYLCNPSTRSLIQLYPTMAQRYKWNITYVLTFLVVGERVCQMFRFFAKSRMKLF